MTPKTLHPGKIFAVNLPTLLAVLLSLSTVQTHSQVYKTVDENGKTIFTDKPSKKAVPVELPTLNTSKPIETSASPNPKKPTTKKAIYSNLQITSPADKTIIPNGLVPFTVTTSLTPALMQDHFLQLLLNGKVYSENTSGSFTVKSVIRGSHTLQVRVVNNNKQTIKQSPSIAIQAYRPGNY